MEFSDRLNRFGDEIFAVLVLPPDKIREAIQAIQESGILD